MESLKGESGGEEEAVVSESGDENLSPPVRDEVDQNQSQDVIWDIKCYDDTKIPRTTRRVWLPRNPFEHMNLSRKRQPRGRVLNIVFDVHGSNAPDTWDGKDNLFPPPFRPPKPLGRWPGEASEQSDSEHDSSDDESYNHESKAEEGLPSLNEVSEIEPFKALELQPYSIVIYSQNLLRLFRRFIGDYPGYSFNGKSLRVSPPNYQPLVHYYNDLVALNDGTFEPGFEFEHVSELMSKDGSISNGITDLIDDATKSDLTILLNHLKPHYLRIYRPLEALIGTGVVSYKILWFLFKPGSLMYAKVGGNLQGFVFESGRHDTEREDAGTKIKFVRFWEARCWNLSYNAGRIWKSYTLLRIYKFDGVKPILSLSFFPCEYYDKEHGLALKEKLLRTGAKYFQILKECPAHKLYDGPCWDDPWAPDPRTKPLLRPDTEYTGEIVVDHGRRNKPSGSKAGIYNDIPPPDLYLRRPYPSTRDQSNEDNCEDSDGNTELRPLSINLTAFYPVNPDHHENLTPLHYFLLPHRINGFALSTKRKLGFDIEHITDITWPSQHKNPMNTLMLADSDKRVIIALARRYKKDQGPWGADYIANKGEGQIFLLHGPPGTGKTYTVECVAKFTRRPLLRLTVADIGTDEGSMEAVLNQWFDRGALWGAIILIDEADVFLEKRQVKDLKRNSLVSVFLSVMEYYTGMLFLTTNRIGHIDDAFLSRTSLAILYEPLDTGKQQRIWSGFIEKLAEERKDVVLTDRAKKFLERLDKDPTTRDVPWNGREIRNALQSAVALASFEAEEDAESGGEQSSKIWIREDHFQTVVDRRKDFVAYRKSIRNQDEDLRAFVEGSRAMPKKPGEQSQGPVSGGRR
ncbi:hypothetical protein B0O99DRAFT_679939 [Bisporella sp. PMI_857]|nr:hypothetical protein B0O99DRAFT_679939 [Bisporella sp. PMI_857]